MTERIAHFLLRQEWIWKASNDDITLWMVSVVSLAVTIILLAYKG